MTKTVPNYKRGHVLPAVEDEAGDSPDPGTEPYYTINNPTSFVHATSEPYSWLSTTVAGVQQYDLWSAGHIADNEFELYKSDTTRAPTDGR